MLQSIFIALPKKAGTIECDNYRLISLMSHITKIILRILMNRNQRRMNGAISDVQFHYKSGKGTRTAVLCLRMIMEKAIEKQKYLYICFIDYVKAFDKHQELIKVLEQIGIDEENITIIARLYWNQMAAIRVENKLGEWVPIQRGVRQGCVLSPDLFGLYSEKL